MLKDVLDCFKVCIITNPNKAHFFHNGNSLDFTDVSVFFQLKLGHNLDQIILKALHQENLRAVGPRLLFRLLLSISTPISLRDSSKVVRSIGRW